MPYEISEVQVRGLKNLLAKEQPIVERVQPYVQLNDSNKIPLFGLGTWNAQGKELKDAVKAAIQCGYRHIDTASNYRNEHLVGDAIFECINEGICSRQDLFVTTKLWNNSHRRQSVCLALAKSLKALQLSYVDLYLIHYPIAYQEGDVLSPLDSSGKVITTDHDYVDTWLGMEDAKRAGLAKSIGVSNFSGPQIARIIAHKRADPIVPAMNQIECHPYLNQAQLIEFCRSLGIQVTAYSPLGSPGRLDPTKGNQPKLIDDPVVKALANKYQRPPAHVLISYQLKRNVCVIPKAIQAAHIASNLDALTLDLSKDDMDELNALDRNCRFQAFERCIDHKYYPFKE